MNNPDVVLYGNLILDTVYTVDRFPVENASNISNSTYKSVGGVGNVFRQLQRLDHTTIIDIQSAVGQDFEGQYILQDLNSESQNIETYSDYHTSSAVIIADTTHKKRSSIVHWGACTNINKIRVSNARWCHFLYLDRLKFLTIDHLRQMHSSGAILSADLCLSQHTHEEKMRLLHLFRHLDYLIISDVEAFSLTGESGGEAAQSLGQLVRLWAIVHEPSGSHSSNGVDLFSFKHAPDFEVSDVLGAGDMFAASFIYSSMNDKFIDASIEFAHTFATENLK